MLCKIPFASILSKSVIQNQCCMPCYFFFFLLPITLYNVKCSIGLSGCWLAMVQCTQSRIPIFSWKRPLLKGDGRGNNYRKRNKKHYQELSHVLQWYPFLPCRFYRPCSAPPFISVGKGRTVVFENWVGCAPQADTWEHLGNIDPWITTDKLCLYKLFSVCSH